MRAQPGAKVCRLALTGFMGAGKSTVGELLARTLGWRFLDLDNVLEADCRKTVAEIFRDHGEAYFRAREHHALSAVLNEDKIVLALGGGAIEDSRSHALLTASFGTCLVFLDAPLSELLTRVRQNAGVRPLLAEREMLEERLGRRLPLYRSAHLTLLTTGLTPKQVADRILEELGRNWLIEARTIEAP